MNKLLTTLLAGLFAVSISAGAFAADVAKEKPADAAATPAAPAADAAKEKPAAPAKKAKKAKKGMKKAEPKAEAPKADAPADK